jgi:hypothetical protein
MIQRLMTAQTTDQKTLAFLQNFFLVIAAFGFVFYGVEHWVIDHQTLSSPWALLPLYVSLVGAPLSIAMFFSTHRILTYVFLVAMAIAVLTGLLGALLHLIWNLQDVGGVFWSISDLIEAFQIPYRPVLAGLAHTHVGAVGMAVGLTAWVKD